MHSHKVKDDHSRTFNIKSCLIIGVNDRKSETSFSTNTHLVLSCEQLCADREGLVTLMNRDRSPTVKHYPRSPVQLICKAKHRIWANQQSRNVMGLSTILYSRNRHWQFLFSDVVSSAVMFLPLSVILSSVSLILLWKKKVGSLKHSLVNCYLLMTARVDFYLHVMLSFQFGKLPSAIAAKKQKQTKRANK